MDNKKNNFRIIWAFSMLAIYFGMSFLLIFTKVFEANLVLWVRILFGVAFFLYGVFRAYRIWKYNK